MHQSTVPSENVVKYAPLETHREIESFNYRSASPVHPKSNVAKWPSEPKTLGESASSWVWRLLPHILLLLVPLGFIGLGIAVIKINGDTESNTGNNIKQAMDVTSTLWPILFAAVIGPTLKALALYHAERGSKLGLLEVLSSSHTLVSTIRGCFTLRILTLWPIFLIIIWALSPLGGQAALRSIELRDSTKAQDYDLSIHMNNNLSAFIPNVNRIGSRIKNRRHHLQALAGAAFSTPDSGLIQAGSSNNFSLALQQVGGMPEAIRITQRDLWRNVRIPFYHTLAKAHPGNSDWIDVEHDKITEYSSLIGVPIRGLPRGQIGSTTFKIQSNYQTAKCKPWVLAIQWSRANEGNFTFVPNITSEPKSSREQKPNMFFMLVHDRNRPGTASSDRLLTTNFSTPIANLTEPSRKLTLGIRTIGRMSLCEIGTEYVDSMVDCSRPTRNGELTCFVSKIRRTPEIQNSGNLTALDIDMTWKVLEEIPYTLQHEYPESPSILESWIRDPPSALTNPFISGAESYDPFINLPLDVFGDRLAVVLNTHLRASLNMTVTVGSDGTTPETRDAKWASTAATWIESTARVYHVKRSWFPIYFLSAISLAACAIANIVLRSLIVVPDFFGSISGLTRDSPFFNVPTPASGMDGTERSRLLQDKWVMIQDVRPADKIGRIAFSDSAICAPLQKDRRYI